MKPEVFSDMSERLNYNLLDFPLYVHKEELCNFDRHTAACHWHPDLEFVLVLDGEMDYFVNSQILHIDTDEGIFVNSRRLHYGYSRTGSDCSFLIVDVHPSLLGAQTHIGSFHFNSKFGIESEDYILLTDDNGWKSEALKSIRLIYEQMNDDERNPLRLISQAASLCAHTGDHIKPASLLQSDELAQLTVWNMIGFIKNNYGRKISLDDIAAAGSVCRSKCCEYFSKYVGKTPNAYLTRYRIGKGGEMLRETNRSVLEVAIACGFQSPSYFTRVFQKELSMTPREYRDHSNIEIDGV